MAAIASVKGKLDLGTAPVGALIKKFSVPAIIGMLINGLYNIVDRIFIGNMPGVGNSAIAGVGIFAPVMTIILAFGLLIGIGSVTNVSIKQGQQKHGEAAKIVGNAIVTSVMIGLIITVVGIASQDYILKSFGASETVLPFAKEYGTTIIAGTVFGILTAVFNNIIRADGNPKLSSMLMVISCLINIALDAILIYGFNMGIQGAAIATVVAQIFTTVAGIIYFVSKKSNIRLRLSDLKPSFISNMQIMALGSSPFIIQMASSAIMIIINNTIKNYGTDIHIAAYTTVISLAMFIFMPMVGLTHGLQPIIGFNYGAKKFDRTKQAIKIGVIASGIWMTLLWIIIQLFPGTFINLFTNNETLVAEGIKIIRSYMIAMPLIAIAFVGTSYMQSIGKPMHALFLNLFRQVIMIMPLIIILPKLIGLDGIWFAQPISDVVSTVLVVLIVLREFKITKRMLP